MFRHMSKNEIILDVAMDRMMIDAAKEANHKACPKEVAEALDLCQQTIQKRHPFEDISNFKIPCPASLLQKWNKPIDGLH